MYIYSLFSYSARDLFLCNEFIMQPVLEHLGLDLSDPSKAGLSFTHAGYDLSWTWPNPQESQP